MEPAAGRTDAGGVLNPVNLSRVGRGALRRLALAALLAVATLAVLTVPGPDLARADAECDRYASTTGSSAETGTYEQPFRSAQRLIDSLRPGETGCLRGGTFRENLAFRRGGSSGQPVILRSQPGERATVLGAVQVHEGADFVEVRMLDLDGSAAPPCDGGAQCEILASPWIRGDDAVFADNDVTNHNRAICFLIGVMGRSPAERTVIRNNRIHHCGGLPADNHGHGLYVENAVDTRIERNLVHSNADRGVQLYPRAIRSAIRGNVFDGNGENVHFGQASDGNRVEGNVITNSRIRFNVESYEASGTDNLVRSNCVHGGARTGSPAGSGIESPQVGFTASGNIHQDPRYADPSDGDYRLRADSPCRGLFGDGEVGPREDGVEAPPAEPTDPASCPLSGQTAAGIAADELEAQDGGGASDEATPDGDGAVSGDEEDSGDAEDDSGDEEASGGEDRDEGETDDESSDDADADDDEDADEGAGGGEAGDAGVAESDADDAEGTGDTASDGEDPDTEAASTEDGEGGDPGASDSEGSDVDGSEVSVAADEGCDGGVDGDSDSAGSGHPGGSDDSGGSGDDAGGDSGDGGSSGGGSGGGGSGGSGGSGGGAGSGGGSSGAPGLPATVPTPAALTPAVPSAAPAGRGHGAVYQRCVRRGIRSARSPGGRHVLRRRCARLAARANDRRAQAQRAARSSGGHGPPAVVGVP